MRHIIAIASGCVLACLAPTVTAKTLTVVNESAVDVVSMSVETIDKTKNDKKDKKPKKQFPVGLGAGKKDHDIKQNAGRENHPEKKIELTVLDELPEEECVADVEFALSNGKAVTYPGIDLCSTAGLIIEDDLVEQPVPPPDPAPTTQP
jgi:hypothetical protein